MNAAADIRIDPSIGLAFALPIVSVVGERLVLDWPDRRSVVVVETEASIRRAEAEQRRKAGAPKQSVARRRSRRNVPTKRSTDVALNRLIDARDIGGLLDRATASPGDVGGPIGALLSFDGHTISDPARILAALADTDPDRLHAFSAERLTVRSLLPVDVGVLARVPAGGTLLALLRTQLHEDLDDTDAADAELAAEPVDTVALIRRCTLARDRDRFECVLDWTSGVTSLDDSTSYLCVLKGSAAAALGHDSEAFAAYSEAVRLPRTNQRIVIRMLLERGRRRVAKGHLGKALVDLKRVRGIEPNIDGIDRAIRTLTRRR